MGRHTKYGGYVVEWSKVRTYVVPADMKGFMVSFPMRESSGKEGGEISQKERERHVYMLTLEHHQLSPFVTKKVEAPKGKFGKDPQGALSGRRYFKKWEEENGAD